MILLVSPAARANVSGNRVTSERWAAILRELGHEVELAEHYPAGTNGTGIDGAGPSASGTNGAGGPGTDGPGNDTERNAGGPHYRALLVLHARKSADAVRAFRADHPHAPIVLALTGTDLYPSPSAAGVDPAVLNMASRLVVLQPEALDRLEPAQRERTTVIHQSMPDIPANPPQEGTFEVAVLAHLRGVKDPLRAAAATHLLPRDSRIRISHAGAAIDDDLAAAARHETATNPRYDWLGELPRPEALAVLARSKLLALSSTHEGGANVISEALAAGVPVIASEIPGSTGMLGADYPGYFPAGDTAALAELLAAVESDTDGLHGRLVRRCRELRDTVSPQAEHRAWAGLLAELHLAAPP